MINPSKAAKFPIASERLKLQANRPMLPTMIAAKFPIASERLKLFGASLPYSHHTKTAEFPISSKRLILAGRLGRADQAYRAAKFPIASERLKPFSPNVVVEAIGV